MEFKYQSDYDSLRETCPPAEYKPMEIEKVYRWVFEEIDDQRNFMSQYHKNPKRFLSKGDMEKCGAIALSMFDDLAGSIKRFQELKEIIGENVYSVLGNKISEGTLSLTDGVNSEPDFKRHFNHHPSSLENYKFSFRILNEII